MFKTSQPLLVDYCFGGCTTLYVFVDDHNPCQRLRMFDFSGNPIKKMHEKSPPKKYLQKHQTATSSGLRHEFSQEKLVANEEGG